MGRQHSFILDVENIYRNLYRLFKVQSPPVSLLTPSTHTLSSRDLRPLPVDPSVKFSLPFRPHHKKQNPEKKNTWRKDGKRVEVGIVKEKDELVDHGSTTSMSGSNVDHRMTIHKLLIDRIFFFRGTKHRKR